MRKIVEIEERFKREMVQKRALLKTTARSIQSYIDCLDNTSMTTFHRVSTDITRSLQEHFGTPQVRSPQEMGSSDNIMLMMVHYRALFSEIAQ